eukprot:CAMPEP_0115504880 /NCGR_PEP_ID=MMETSP0271-20121206/70258_1 /TAXON_ID=71861 /ORGANISM="Scrippsiella trochoidea, Strain CCMP3099" /LENGTH=136 /DNA_ID=CAMNT_0002934093 /DNA_START=183 /DNA_END=593 /DNA_ORIENTATION=+
MDSKCLSAKLTGIKRKHPEDGAKDPSLPRRGPPGMVEGNPGCQCSHFCNHDLAGWPSTTGRGPSASLSRVPCRRAHSSHRPHVAGEHNQGYPRKNSWPKTQHPSNGGTRSRSQSRRSSSTAPAARRKGNRLWPTPH